SCADNEAVAAKIVAQAIAFSFQRYVDRRIIRSFSPRSCTSSSNFAHASFWCNGRSVSDLSPIASRILTSDLQTRSFAAVNPPMSALSTGVLSENSYPARGGGTGLKIAAVAAVAVDSKARLILQLICQPTDYQTAT